MSKRPSKPLSGSGGKITKFFAAAPVRVQPPELSQTPELSQVPELPSAEPSIPITSAPAILVPSSSGLLIFLFYTHFAFFLNFAYNYGFF